MLGKVEKLVNELQESGFVEEAKRMQSFGKYLVRRGINPDNEVLPRLFLPKTRKEKQIFPLKPSAEVKYIETLRRDDSPFLNPGLLEKDIEQKGASLSIKTKDHMKWIVARIKLDGTTSIAHLNLPIKALHILLRNNIRDIGALRQVRDQGINFIQSGPGFTATIDQALNVFDQRMDKLQRGSKD